MRGRAGGETTNRIDDTFVRLRAQGAKALIPYVMAGDPDLATTEKWALAAADSGADLLEIGVPFSDPLADGPTLQQAAQRALASRTTLSGALALAQRLRAKIEIPLVLMLYYNLIFQYGNDRFVRDAVDAGVDGLIVPDLPLEEAQPLEEAARAAALHLIHLIAPTTPSARIADIARRGAGFLYYVSLTGITGAALPALEEIEQRVRAIKRATALPVAVGFGISTPEEAARIARVADGVVVASALIKRLHALSNPDHRIRELTRYLTAMKRALVSG